jgi:glycine C-acetyltransferase
VGLDTLGSETNIIPVFVGDDAAAFRICEELLQLGIFTTPVAYPAVPKGRAAIRCSVMPSHTNEDLDLALGAFAQVAAAVLAANDVHVAGTN